MLNAAASSTREMGLGSRHDTLDDLFAYHNWQKTTGLGVSLKRKYLLAAVEARRHKELHEDFCDSVPASVRVVWTQMIADWELNKSKPNPYEVKVDYETEADIKHRLLVLECRDNAAVTGDGEKSETSWLATGLMIEETQRRLSLERADSLTSIQAAQFQEKRLLLQRQIKTFRRLQASHMRLPKALIQNNNPSEPETIPLHLPSSFPATAQSQFCSPSLLNKEKKHVTGQRANTKAHNEFERYELKIKQATLKYRAARTALAGLLGTAAVPPQFRELRDKDITPPPAFDIEPSRATTMALAAAQLGEGSWEVSWIWRVPGVYNNSDVSLNDGLRVEWAKSRARSLRWNEELLLVKEEMRRVRATFRHRASVWQERANYTPSTTNGATHLLATDTTLLQGLNAYAHRQRLVNKRLHASFTALWERPPGKRSHFAMLNIQPLNAQELVTADDEALMSELTAVVQVSEDEGEEEDE
ncbi:hypothetical protein ONZ45_g11202 [Pleurotus djamor]|nr:hypothetical protein ONZ45_g11202 [Pleurotus djamor]